MGDVAYLSNGDAFLEQFPEFDWAHKSNGGREQFRIQVNHVRRSISRLFSSESGVS